MIWRQKYAETRALLARAEAEVDRMREINAILREGSLATTELLTSRADDLADRAEKLEFSLDRVLKESLSPTGDHMEPDVRYGYELAMTRIREAINKKHDDASAFGARVSSGAIFMNAVASGGGRAVNMSDECIDVVELLPFNVGNAIKYLWRCDSKGAPLVDLRKAAWYVEREIARRSRELAS